MRPRGGGLLLARGLVLLPAACAAACVNDWKYKYMPGALAAAIVGGGGL
eukprot:gene17694-19122_t